MSSTLEERDIHKRIHAKLKLVRYQPVSVAEVLKKLRLYLHTVIELGSFTYLSGDELAARHIIELESVVDELAYQLLIHMAVVVGHDIDSAPKAAPIYMYVFGVDKIMDAFKDLASLVIKGVAPSKELYHQLVAISNVVVTRIRGDRLAGRSVEELREKYAVEVLAILRGGKWILNPQDEVVREYDVIYVKGFKDNVGDLLEDIGEERPAELKPPEGMEKILSSITSMIDFLLVMNDLAHYQLKAQDPMLAEELLEMEVFLDDLRVDASKKVIGLQGLDETDKLALLTLITRLEDTSDSLTYIIMMPAEEECRELLSAILEEGSERIRVFRCWRRASLDELAEKLEDLGASILAVRRGSEWIAVTPYNIHGLTVEPGDAILVSYDVALEDEVLRLLGSLGVKA